MHVISSYKIKELFLYRGIHSRISIDNIPKLFENLVSKHNTARFYRKYDTI